MTGEPHRHRMRAAVLSHVRSHGDRLFRPKELSRRLEVSSRRDYELFREVLDELVESGLVARVPGGRIGYRKRASRTEGVLRVRPDGYGFVTVDGEADDFYVGSRRMGTALDGDRVEIGLDAPRKDDRRREAEVIRVLDRGRRTAVGTFRETGRFGRVTPDDRRLTHEIFVTDPANAADDDKVVVSIDRFDDPRGAPQGRVLRVLGPSSDAAVRTLALAMAMGVDADFPAEAIAEAEAAPASIPPGALAGREDFRSEAVFTIDPVDARDFDDAIHVRPLADRKFEVGVHIADVSAFVAPESALDDTAYARGTSVYLVDRVIPMLPERLSGELCSLRPDEDRLTLSCVLVMDADAEVTAYRIVESVIRSRARLTYEEAQAILDGRGGEAAADGGDARGGEAAAGGSDGRGAEHGAGAGAGVARRVDPDVGRGLALAAKLARKLRGRRLAAGGIDFDLPEVRVVLDDAGVVQGLVRRERLEAHRLIEELMLLANRTVAAHATRRHPENAFVFRVHDVPNRERITQLVGYVRAFGYRITSRGGAIEGAELNRLLDACRGKPEEPVIEEAALRAMAKATYSPDNIGHFGLAFAEYTHFTSPIRRYPDLMVHRLLKDLAEGRATPPYEQLKARCDHSAERERAADEAQRESVKLKQVEFMQQHVGDTFTGVVSGVTRFGLFVELDALLVEGLVHVRDLPDDYYEYDETAYALVGRFTGRRFRLGDSLAVVVASANTETREIDFVLSDH